MKLNVLCAMLLSLGAAGLLVAQDVRYVSTERVVLDGYDVVAYHTEGVARRGGVHLGVRYNDQIWYFATAENRELFSANPEEYLPAYGGYCAYAAANNAIAPVDPLAFTIVDGTLYLNFSRGVKRRWDRRSREYIQIADRYWTTLRNSVLQ